MTLPRVWQTGAPRIRADPRVWCGQKLSAVVLAHEQMELRTQARSPRRVCAELAVKMPTSRVL